MKKYYKSILILSFVLACMAMQAQESLLESNPTIGLNSELSYNMMEHNQDLRKISTLLRAKSNGSLSKRSLNFGFSILGIMDVQKSNTDSKFAYLMRHPTSNNQIGKIANEAVIHSAQFSVTASMNNWISAYGELLYDPEQSFGAGTITTLTRNQIQLRKGIILLGNLKKMPIYFSLGKMDMNFGQMGSVSPFTNSTMWHAFGTLGYGAILGFNSNGIDLSLSAIQGGAQFRALHVPVDSTSVPSRINNFAVDVNYTYNINSLSMIRLGASYLKGTAYCQDFPVVHFTPCDDFNPAYTFYGMLELNKRLTLKASFAKTTKVWSGTANPNPPQDQWSASKVSSLDYGAKYLLNPSGNTKYTISTEFSNFIAGPAGSPWEKQTQIVLGFNAQVEGTNRLFLETFRTTGYAPLNFISGGHIPAQPGVTHSDRNANSIGFVIGALLSI